VFKKVAGLRGIEEVKLAAAVRVNVLKFFKLSEEELS